MNILDKIIAAKRLEVSERKLGVPVQVLKETLGFQRKVFSLKQFLLDDSRNGIIAEFKRRSPSKGIINASADVQTVTSGYATYGAAALSILTDSQFFGGSTTDLETARLNDIPILRKDFIIDEYQLVEAKSMGADVILLIAACLSPLESKTLAEAATALGLEVLLELHDESELDHVNEFTPIIGINNRNLKTFMVDIDKSLAMASLLPVDSIKIAESGISTVEDILKFRENGFRGFLMGEYFMKEKHPDLAFREFAQHLKSLSV